MNLHSHLVTIWDPSGSQKVKVPQLHAINSPKIEDTEHCAKFLKSEITNYLKNRKPQKESLRVELSSVDSGGKGGSVFNVAKLWSKVYFSLERMADRSANTVSISWVGLDAKNFDELLDSSIKNLLVNDVITLRQRAQLRDDFWKSTKSASN